MSVSQLLATSLLITVSACSAVFAGQCEKHSGYARAGLIELYTSEGCSSCPPADRWLRTLVPNVLSAEEVVPLAFHVDYWDRLGWRDRFANPAYTARQYDYAKVSGSAYVFTPQVILAGRNFQAWANSGSVRQAVRSARTVAPDASIVLRQQSVRANKVEFEVRAQLRQDVNFSDAHIYAALFQNGLVSDVGKGENSGSRLQHDYVVRGLLTSNAVDRSGQIIFKDHFILPDDAQVAAMGLAVFVQDARTGVVLQAVAAPLCVAGK